MKISACLISKEPSESLSRAITSVRPLVDEVVVAFNRTLDEKTGAIDSDRRAYFLDCNANRNCAKVLPCGCQKGDLLDFASLRNRSFSIATGDWVLWLDSDDILEFTDPDALRKLAAGPPRTYRFPYEYYSGYDIWTDRLVPRVLARWKWPIHEVLEIPGLEVVKSEAVRWVHKRDPNNDALTRNLRIGLHWKDSAEFKDDFRFNFYLGQSYANADRKEEAIAAYGKAFSLGVDRFEEMFVAADWCSKLNVQLGKYREGLEWAFKSIQVWPGQGNGYLQAGICFYHVATHFNEFHHFHNSVKYFRIGNTFGLLRVIVPMPKNEDTLFEADKLFNVSLGRIGELEAALATAERALKHAPDDLTQKNALIYRSFLNRQVLIPKIQELVSCYGAGSEAADDTVKDTFAQIGKLAPKGFSAVSLAALGPVKTIAIVCSYQWEAWNPLSPPGGSETAVVELSKRLAARGYTVSVFSDPLLGGPATFDGVSWRGTGYSEDPAEEFDLLIGWRGLDRVEGGKAKRRVLWLHDMAVQFSSPKRLNLIDAVVVNSQWHAEIVRPALPGKRIEVLGAGLDPKRLEAWPEKRERSACVWASSWDRGLDFMLDIWPDVRAAAGFPNPQLHVLYGCEGSLNMARKKGDKASEERILGFKAKAEKTPGVVLHGRVPNPEYDQIMLRSGVFAYPAQSTGNDFGETFCVSICEAVCAGLRVVLTPYSALREVASPYAFRQIYGKNEDKSYREAFTTAIVEAMTAPEDGTRELLAEKARAQFDWDRVADRWVERIIK